MDHVLARGGLDDLANLVPACTSCNKQKSDRTPPVWWMSAWLPWFYDSRWRATPQGDEKTRSLRDRYFEIHEEVLGILNTLDDVAAEIADPVRTSWFRKSSRLSRTGGVSPPRRASGQRSVDGLSDDGRSPLASGGGPELETQ